MGSLASQECYQSKDNVLLVEGKNDLHVVLALRNVFGVNSDFNVCECGSRELAIKRFGAMILEPNGAKRLGIVIDADNDSAKECWEIVRNKVEGHGYTFPQKPSAGGITIGGSGRLPNIGVWVMPDNDSPGVLEDFLFRMADQHVLAQACSCVETAKSLQLATFKDIHYSKAVIHTYLAWQDEPGMPLGLAVTARLFAVDSELGKAFALWVDKLFA